MIDVISDNLTSTFTNAMPGIACYAAFIGFMFALSPVRYAKSKEAIMDLVLWLIFIVLAYIALMLTKAVNALHNIKSTSEISIKCLDAHELLIKKANDEIEQQGVAIEQIRDIMFEKR